MRIFLSHSSKNAEIAAQLQQALERRNIKTFSNLDAPVGDNWAETIENRSADADALVFLLGDRPSFDPQLQAEWQALLRSDWDGMKPMIPVLLQGQSQADLPKFLANRNALFSTNIDNLARQIEHVVQNPAEGRILKSSERARAEQADRLEDIRHFAEALKLESHASDNVGHL